MKTWLAKHRTALINISVLAGLAYLIISKFDELKQSAAAIQDANPAWIIFGICVYFLGMPLMAMQLNAIALKPLRYFVTYKVQMAALFVNRVVPSNLGLALLTTYYLKRYDHSNTETATVISVSAITSAFAFATIIMIGLLAGQGGEILSEAHVSVSSWILPIVGAFVALAAFVLWRLPALRQKISQPFHDIIRQLGGYRHRPFDITKAIIGNGLATLTSVVTLYACAESLGTPISLSLALMTYVLGNALGGLVPTPGGLGGVEAGLYAGLVIGGVPNGAALSIVLLYRLITYWLAFIPGILFFVWLRKDVLADFSFSKTK